MRLARIRFGVLVLSILFTTFAALADGFYIAPHLQSVTTDGVTLIWETQDEGIGAVEYGLEGQFGKQAAEATLVKVYRVRIASLTPDTIYSYRIHAGADVHTNTFKTAPRFRPRGLALGKGEPLWPLFLRLQRILPCVRLYLVLVRRRVAVRGVLERACKKVLDDRAGVGDPDQGKGAMTHFC